VKANASFRRFRRRLKQRTDFLVDAAQSAIVREEGFLDVHQALLQSRAGEQFIAQANKCPNDIDFVLRADLRFQFGASSLQALAAQLESQSLPGSARHFAALRD
jgi:hypothetical protein